jgi:hypothetical protein
MLISHGRPRCARALAFSPEQLPHIVSPTANASAQSPTAAATTARSEEKRGRLGSVTAVLPRLKIGSRRRAPASSAALSRRALRRRQSAHVWAPELAKVLAEGVWKVSVFALIPGSEHWSWPSYVSYVPKADIEYRTKSELDSPPHFFIYEEITKGKSSAYY